MRRPLTLALSLALTGCIGQAEIVRDDGRLYSGRIVRSNADTVFMEVDGREVAVPRSRIAHVEHPGGGARAFGLIGLPFALGLTGVGVYASYAVRASEDSDAQDALADIPLFFGLAGVAIHAYAAIRGGRAWDASHAAIEPPTGESPPPAPSPTAELLPTGIRVRF